MNSLYRSKRLRIGFSLFLAMILAACAARNNSVSSPTAIPQKWNQNELEQMIKAWRVSSGVPGVVVGISFPGQADILLASGTSDVKDNITIMENGQFRIASITKTFIAAEILKLAAKGKINLDDPLNAYLPETPYGEVVTVRHLLRHRSGYFDPLHDDPTFIPQVAENLGRLWTWDEILGLAFQHDLYFQPGTAYQYSNTNYMLLAKIIEQVSQKPLGEALTLDLLRPLHLDNTFYATPTTESEPANLIHGYATHPLTGEIIDTTSIPYATVLSVSADTMVSNASDLLKWSRALYGKEALVLEPVFQKQMLTFDEISNYGLGVFQFNTPVGGSFGHGGDTAGYLSQMEYVPSQDLSIVILANRDAPSINLSELRDSILVALFGDSAERHVEELIADLKSTDPAARKNAISALGHSGIGNDQVISSLIEILKSDPVAENRKEAALALGLVGRSSKEANRALTGALQDSDQTVKEAAQLALSAIEQ
jgi:D-alanyl-D-alanine carboxypeptidase